VEPNKSDHHLDEISPELRNALLSGAHQYMYYNNMESLCRVLKCMIHFTGRRSNSEAANISNWVIPVCLVVLIVVAACIVLSYYIKRKKKGTDYMVLSVNRHVPS